MAGPCGKFAVAARLQDARNRALRDRNAELCCDLGFEVHAAPADHAVRHGVRLGFHHLAEASELGLAQKRLAPCARPVAQAIHSFGVIAMHPIGQGLPVHARKPRCLASRCSLQYQGQRQQPPGLVRIADAARLAPKLVRRKIRPCDFDSHRSPKRINRLRESQRRALLNRHRTSQEF